MSLLASHPTDDESVRRMGHPGFVARPELVAPHPTDDESVRRMGHPASTLDYWLEMVAMVPSILVMLMVNFSL
jgi:hypothetical protein